MYYVPKTVTNESRDFLDTAYTNSLEPLVYYRNHVCNGFEQCQLIAFKSRGLSYKRALKIPVGFFGQLHRGRGGLIVLRFAAACRRLTAYTEFACPKLRANQTCCKHAETDAIDPERTLRGVGF